MRVLTQPGTPLQPRRLSAWADASDELRLCLPQGADLLEGLRDALKARGVMHAAVTFSAARFDRFSYLTGQPDHSGERAATYGAPTDLDGPVDLIGANAIVGCDGAGVALVHCHAVVVDRDGRVHGGHVPPGSGRLGRGGAVAWVAVLDGAGFRVAYDSETNYPIFGPVDLTPSAAPDMTERRTR